MNNFTNFSVIGSGSWGSAIACHLSRIHQSVKIYSDSQEIADEINNKKLNSKYLGSITLPSNLIATNQIEEILDSEIIFIVVPSSWSDLLFIFFIRIVTCYMFECTLIFVR